MSDREQPNYLQHCLNTHDVKNILPIHLKDSHWFWGFCLIFRENSPFFPVPTFLAVISPRYIKAAELLVVGFHRVPQMKFFAEKIWASSWVIFLAVFSYKNTTSFFLMLRGSTKLQWVEADLWSTKIQKNSRYYDVTASWVVFEWNMHHTSHEAQELYLTNLQQIAKGTRTKLFGETKQIL